MLFNSINFCLSFLFLFLIYRRLNLSNQNLLLLIAGIIFYASWDYRFILLLLALIYFNFRIGKRIEKDSKERKFLFYLAISTNVLFLFFFKYIVFTVIAINDGLSIFNFTSIHLPIPKIILPIGISFYTFHNISYIYDVYKRKILPTQSLLSYSIYDLFFPLLLAGPIERAEKLIPQIENPRTISKENVLSGINLFLYGVFKKVFIADNLIIFIEKSMSDSMNLPLGIHYYTAPIFAFQLYADFSGYSDCAIGLARILGFELSLNFKYPFTSINVIEFWKRWHISLSSWLKDYIYIPLGGNRLGFFRQNINLIIVWILGGLWHGASYGFFIWGLFCGIQIVVYNLLNKFIFKNIKFDSLLFKFVSAFTVFYLFGVGLLLFLIKSKEHLVSTIINFSGFYWNPILLLKLLFFIFPLILIESYQILNDDIGFKKLIRNKLLLSIVYPTYFILFTLFGVFEKKEFFYFHF